MSLHLTIPMALLIFACILMESARELSFKRASAADGMSEIIKQPYTWLGITLWAIEIVAWIMVLEHVPLGVAFPLASLNYVVTVFGGYALFNEKITRNHLVGALCITLGVACVGATGL